MQKAAEDLLAKQAKIEQTTNCDHCQRGQSIDQYKEKLAGDIASLEAQREEKLEQLPRTMRKPTNSLQPQLNEPQHASSEQQFAPMCE